MKSDKITLSACLVVHNEEKVIERCLTSIKDVVDEIVLVHDGPCEDKTLEIASNFDVKIFKSAYQGEAEPLRPLSYSQASGAWILQIDGDEFLSPELQKVIPALIHDIKVSGYEFLWPLFDGKKYRTAGWPYKLALFRRSQISFLGIPHFSPDVNGVVKKVSYLLEHKPHYNNYSWKIFRKKWLVWSKIQAQLYLKDFKDIKKYNYSSETWPFSIRFRRSLPLAALVIDPIIIFIKTLFSGAWKEGGYGWRTAFLYACFRILIDWNIFINKCKKV